MRKTLTENIDLNSLRVKVTFPNGEEETLTFNEVSQYALDCKDLGLCPALIKEGSTVKGSLTYTLIK